MIRKIRIKKLDNIRQAGIDPYPTQVKRTHTCQETIDNFAKLTDKELFLVGRLRAIREHGGSTFAHIEDISGKIQIYFKKDGLAEGKYKFFLDNFDIGDFIEVKGTLFLTKRGEKTLLVKDYRILSKSLLPLPEKWHGLKDIEERFRKRYLDLLMNKQVLDNFLARSQIIKTIREFLGERGFVEVETPILQPIPGGASAKPFKTHHNALDMNLYLRIAPELYLKRLLVGGLERIYEIGRCFRNEGLDASHNPDFTMLECYAAYWDWHDLMEFMEELMRSVDPKIFPKKWRRVEYKDVVKKGQEKESFAKIEEPTFILHLPDIPLAKKGQALQGVVRGIELIKAFTEQNDPIEQKQALKKQQAYRYDQDFIEALEYGMPPAAGFGLGLDRLAALLTNSHSLREVILFPLMKPKKGSTFQARP